MNYFYVFIGSGIGGVLRFIFSKIIYTASGSIFPFGTLVVNITGCFAIGFFSGLFEIMSIPSNVRLFVFVGLLGGFTTFSSLELETFNLLMMTKIEYALLDVFINIFLGLVLVFAGFTLANFLVRVLR